MTSDAAEYREIAGRFTALVRGVPDDQTWSRRSPAPEWTAGDVVGHLVEWFPGFLEAPEDADAQSRPLAFIGRDPRRPG